MSDINGLTNLFSNAEINPDGPECQVNQLAEQLANFAIQDIEIASRGSQNKVASWPQTEWDNDEFLHMAGFDLSEFQNDDSPYDIALTAAGVDPVAFRQQNSKLEWENLVKQMEEIERTHKANIASNSICPNNVALPFNDDGLLESMTSYLASLPPMTLLTAPHTPHSTEDLGSLLQGELLRPSAQYEYDHWADVLGHEIAKKHILENVHELEVMIIWMAEEIWKRIKQDSKYCPPFSPKSHPFHSPNIAIVAHVHQQVLEEIQKRRKLPKLSEAAGQGVTDVEDEEL